MPKRQRRDHHHLRQESQKKRSFAAGGRPQEAYKPGFPMNIFGNIKLFAIIGVVVAVILVVTAVLTTNLNTSADADPDTRPTATPTVAGSVTGTATGSATATNTALSFAAADQVIDPAASTYTATLETSEGDIVIRLNADVAPKTVNSFVFLAQKGYFDGITFHRVSTDFVIQSGDPTATGGGNPGYTTADEPNQVSNARGTVSMAKTRGAAVFGSQFFINVKNNTALDYTSSADKFYPFGEVIEGMDVVDAINEVPTDRQTEKPLEDVVIESVTIEETPKPGVTPSATATGTASATTTPTP